ncbi:hypothetical protein BHE74_00033039, partial [Ensete ventricosum]
APGNINPPGRIERSKISDKHWKNIKKIYEKKNRKERGVSTASPGGAKDGNADGDGDADGSEGVGRDLRQRPRPRARHRNDLFRWTKTRVPVGARREEDRFGLENPHGKPSDRQGRGT